MSDAKHQPDEYTAFQEALKNWSGPDDECNQYHADEGALYWLWGRATAWASKRKSVQVRCNSCGNPVQDLLPASGWEPIETAPKDGTEITGGWVRPFSDFSGTPICWQKGDSHEGWFMLTPQQWGERFVLGTYPGRWIREVEYPTHWMPKLPEPKRNELKSDTP